MFSNGKNTIKKGYIILYTTVIGLICMTMALFCYSYEMSVRKNNKYFNTPTEISLKRQEYKEYLFTYLNYYVKENIKELSKEEIRNYFTEKEDSFKFQYKKSYITYDKTRDCFVEVYVREEKMLEKDYYSYEVKDSSIILNYLDTEYIRGQI